MEYCEPKIFKKMQDCKPNYFDRRWYDIYDKLKAETFNTYFADITKTLKLKKYQSFDGQSLFSITDYFKNNERFIAKIVVSLQLISQKSPS